MVTNGHMQIANGMRSDGPTVPPGRLGVPRGPARWAEPARRARAGTTPSAPAEDLESRQTDEYPLIAGVLLVNRSQARGLFGSLRPG
jgi:hypothetical protein